MRPILVAGLLALAAFPCRTREPLPAGPQVFGDGAAALAALDKRAPVPLEPMMAWHQKQDMQDHLKAIQGITDGLARQDWDAVAAAASKIGSSPQMEETCERMGAGAPGFAEMGKDFHHRADAIGEAARAHDATAVLAATSDTLQACVQCHAKYRQEVIEAGGEAPMSMEPGGEK